MRSNPFPYRRPAVCRRGSDRPPGPAAAPLREMRKFVGGKPRAVSTETYKNIAKKYGIRMGPIGETAQKIYNHENKKGVQKGLYFQPKK